jgi:hypothetical protein
MKSPPAIPEYLNWSAMSITFSRADHPSQVPRPGHAALVLEAQVGGYEMSWVFMDGGSGINIIFADTLCNMNRSLTNLLHSDTTFHGIVPGKPVLPWVLLHWMSSLASRRILGAKGSTSKSSTGHRSTMPYSDDPRSQGSWPYLIMRISN